MLGEKPYTVEALAERWSISEWTIYNMLNAGRLRGFRLGSRMWRISAEEVARYEAAPDVMTSEDAVEKRPRRKAAELRLMIGLSGKPRAIE